VAARTWTVYHCHDDGRREQWPGASELLTYEAAALLAGALRDEQTDDDVGAGWTWLPGRPASFTGSVKTIR
jgi:hypothetical protein